MENKNFLSSSEVVTKENLSEILADIAVKREVKGSSETLIPYIRQIQKEAGKLDEKSVVLQLYQEEFLSAQHMVMEEKSKGFGANPLRAAKGMLFMEITSKNMEKYTEENDVNLDPFIKARVYRFLGRYADYRGQFGRSEVNYRKGLEYFDQSTKQEERFNRLEFLGFLSYSLIKQGKTQEGLDLAQQTLKDFDNSEEGKWLKENNYYAWAVWKSGIEIRTAEHVAKTKDSGHIDLAKDLLEDAGSILVMPDGTMEKFNLRLDELKVAKGLIVKISQ